MNSTKITSYDISISYLRRGDNIWAGTGIYDHTIGINFPGEKKSPPSLSITGNIRDCTAILGGQQEKAEKIYEAIEDAITMVSPCRDGSIEVDGVTWVWALTERNSYTQK